MKKSNMIFWFGLGSIVIAMVIFTLPFNLINTAKKSGVMDVVNVGEHNITSTVMLSSAQKTPVNLQFSDYSPKSGEKVVGNDKSVTKTQVLQSFEAINVNGNFELTIEPGKTSQVVVTADENIMPYIDIGVSQNTLNMGMKSGIVIFSSNSQKAVVTTEKLVNVNMTGNAKLEAKNIQEESITLTLSGNSAVNLAGQVKNLAINLRGNAKVNARDLKADKVTITGAGNLDITVRAAKKLSMTAAGKSNVKYYGNPEINRTAFGFVTIQKLGD